MENKKRITKEYALETAKQFNHKTELCRKAKGVYNYLYRHNLYEEACAHMERKQKHPNKKIEALAKACSSKREFLSKHPEIAAIARKRGLLNKIFPKPTPEQERAELKQIASQYPYPRKWIDGNRSSYLRAERRGWCKEIIQELVDAGIMTPQRYFWSDQELIDEARKHKTKISLLRASPVVTQLIVRRNMQDICYAHMVPAERFAGDNDCIYVWHALDMSYNGLIVVKVGHTSYRLGDDRIEIVAKTANTRFKVLTRSKTSIEAHAVEEKLKGIGTDPKLEKFDGYTEFRAVTEQELSSMLEIVKLHEV